MSINEREGFIALLKKVVGQQAWQYMDERDKRELLSFFDTVIEQRDVARAQLADFGKNTLNVVVANDELPEYTVSSVGYWQLKDLYDKSLATVEVLRNDLVAVEMRDRGKTFVVDHE